MSEKKLHPFVPTLVLFAAFASGAACTRWIGPDWFMDVLGYSMLVAFILAVLLTVDVKEERRPRLPIALFLDVLWLPARNGEVKVGPAMSAFLLVVAWVGGMLLCAMALPAFS